MCHESILFQQNISTKSQNESIDSALVGASSFQWGETQSQFVYLSFQLLGRTFYRYVKIGLGCVKSPRQPGRGITQPSLCSYHTYLLYLMEYPLSNLIKKRPSQTAIRVKSHVVNTQQVTCLKPISHTELRKSHCKSC